MKGLKDIEKFKSNLKNLPVHWDGKESILELKEANYNWKQMEWWAFYFEYKSEQILEGKFEFPGDRFGSVEFDAKGEMNWDMKAAAIKSDNHTVILNDVEATKSSISKYGYHGDVIALCDVEYNDENRTFQKWHSELKGGLSKYEKERRLRTSVSRYRKTKADLSEIIFVIYEKNDLNKLTVMNQGRNSNGKPRPPKYMLDIEKVDEFYVDKMEF